MQTNVFTGRLADTPTLRGNGDKAVCHFTLIDNEYAGTDAEGQSKERQVSVQFAAFRGRGEAIAKHCRKGDQLIVHWRLSNNVYEKNGETVYAFNFNVVDFEFGAPGAAKRAELDDRRG